MSRGIIPLLQAAEYIDQWGPLLSLCDVVLHDFAQTSCVCCSSLSCEQDRPSKICEIKKLVTRRLYYVITVDQCNYWHTALTWKTAPWKTRRKHPKTRMYGWKKCLPLKRGHWTLRRWAFVSSIPLNIRFQTMQPQRYGIQNQCYKSVLHILFCLSKMIRHYASRTMTEITGFTNKWNAKGN